MLYTKTGFPEEGEIVVCTVTSVQYHSVFARLDEYGKTGMLHISEVSPGRIRNLRDYVTENKVIICKVLRVKRDRDQIDLSLRRVNEGQRRNKSNSLKQEQIAEKIIEYVAKDLKTTKEEVFSRIKDKIFAEHELVYGAFEQVLDDEHYLQKIGIEKKLAEPLTKLILERIKPPIVTIKRELQVQLYEPDGVETIRKVLSSIAQENLTVFYEGGGKYFFQLQAPDYKEAERQMEAVLAKVQAGFSKHKAILVKKSS